MIRGSSGIRRLALVAILAAAYALLTLQLKSGTGLTQTIYAGVGGDRTLLAERRVPAIDLSVLENDPSLPRRAVTMRWTGVWDVPTSDVYVIHLSGAGRVTLKSDGRLLHEHAPANQALNPRAVPLDAGFHDVEVEYEHDEPSQLTVAWAPYGGAPRPLDSGRLFVERPEHPRLRRVLEAVHWTLALLGVAGLVVVLYAGVLRLIRWLTEFVTRRVGRSITVSHRRLAAGVLVVLVVAYGAFLRFDALTLSYGPVKRPGWLRAVQQSRAPQSVLRADAVTWLPVTGRYISDPSTYLQGAREMRSFYAAHRREPVFPFVTKTFLWLLNDQDVAVSFASTFFSVLAIAATYLLGAYAFSYAVGLGAAAALAIEYDMISWGIGGWRDDAFTFAVVLSAYMMLRYSRAPTLANAVLAGAVGGFACLIRITSLSFLVPGFAYLLLATGRPWKDRLRGLSLATGTMAVIVAPFLINCWLVFGDPLYSINVHADVYRETEGQPIDRSQTASEYLRARSRTRPMQTLDTAVLGMTSYPFANKWRGFDRWMPSLGKWLSWAALVGVVLLVGSHAGRFVLLVLAASLVPYALTWRLISDWRFTEHAYPFFLIAAFYAIVQGIRLLAPARLRALPRVRPRLKPLVVWGSVVAIVGVSVWGVRRVLPILAVREALAANEAVTIMAGGRDASFFGDGWSRPLPEINVTARAARGAYSVVWLPLPRVQDYDVTVRLDPFPRPLRDDAADLPTVRIFLNDSPIARVDVTWNPLRVGAYNVRIPHGVVKAGLNRLAFMADLRRSPSTADGHAPTLRSEWDTGFRLWYVRVRPPER